MGDKLSDFRRKPREQGKAAYRQGLGREANPYSRSDSSSEWLEWGEGWIWCSVHYPRKEDAYGLSEILVARRCGVKFR